MARAYNAIDADGHILEPARFCGTNTSIPNIASGGRDLSSTRTVRSASASRANCWAIREDRSLGSVGVRQGTVKVTASNMPKGRRAGSTRTPASPTWISTGSTLLSSTSLGCSLAPSRTPARGRDVPCL